MTDKNDEDTKVDPKRGRDEHTITKVDPKRDGDEVTITKVDPKSAGDSEITNVDALRARRPATPNERDSDADLTPLPPPMPFDRESMPVIPRIRQDLDTGSRRIIEEPESDPSISTAPATPSAKADDTKQRRDETRVQTEPVRRPAGPDLWDRVGDWLGAHGALPAVGIITIAVLAIHAHIFTGETAGDDLSFHFAESARLADCLRHGDFDFWNPSANAGYASAYYYQVIPQLASAVPAALFGHHLFWFQLSVVLPLVLAPLLAYRGMRLLGATPWQSAVAAFCVAFMNGESRWGAGNAGTFQVGLYTQTWALCAFPLALGHAARWLQKGTNLAPAIAWGAFVCLCHPFCAIVLGVSVLTAWLAQPILWVVDRVLAVIGRALHDGRGGWRDWLAARWSTPPERAMWTELWRGAVLAIALGITWLPVILPLLIDREGFGGFPHRVSDEIGPGFTKLWGWVLNKDHVGTILDWRKLSEGPWRFPVLTFALPIVIVFARAKFYRWLWAPAFVFALLLGLGPTIGKIGDDLVPAVRFLGAMQTLLAMGIGAGAIIIGSHLWRLADRSPRAYSIRTGLAALAAALVVLVSIPGGPALGARVRVLEDVKASNRDELFQINALLAIQPQGRKAVGPGAENHWWNLLSYAYNRVPSLLQMGGGGLQASPNYDFLWTQRDHVKNAWVFDAPYLVFKTEQGSKMPVGETVGRTEHYEIRRLPTPGLVSPVTVVDVLPPGYRHDEVGHKKALEWIKSERPLKDEVLAYVGSDGVRAPIGGKTLRAWRQDSPGDDADIVAEVDVQTLTTFAIRESWHPRWHAYIDGEAVPVRRITPDFPAVDVLPGRHTIEMRFERPWWAHASWLAWPLVSLAAWLLLRKRSKRIADAEAAAI